MTDAEIAALLDGAALVLILIGALLCVTAAIGLVRFRDVPSRLHAATKPQVLGVVGWPEGVAQQGLCVGVSPVEVGLSARVDPRLQRRRAKQRKGWVRQGQRERRRRWRDWGSFWCMLGRTVQT